MAKILLVEDEITVLDTIAGSLRDAGFEVMAAQDGAEALKMLLSEKPDLAIIDIILPKVDGWRVAEKLKVGPESAKVPVIMLSAIVAQEGKPEDWEIGDFYFSKPVNFEALLKKIREMLEDTRPEPEAK